MSQGQEASQHLQELSQQLQELDQVEGQLEAQIQSARARREEVEDAIEALQELETDATVQVPLGGDAYVKARIEDIEEVIVDLGGDFSAEQTREGAIDALERRTEQVDEQIERIEESLEEVGEDIEQVESRAQQLQQQLMQQQAQAQQGGGGLGLGGPGG